MTIAPETAPLLALGSALSFSLASVVYARFSNEISSAWMNIVKALVCWLSLTVVLSLTGLWTTASPYSQWTLIISGAIGLGIGDLFLLASFARIGAARTLLLFGFQPVFVGLAATVLFKQPVSAIQGIGIVFFIACLVTLALEKYHAEGHWELRGLLFALIGVTLDNVGILLTRSSFEETPAMDPMYANWIRTCGALGVLAIYAAIKPVSLVPRFLALTGKDKTIVLLASVAGTFLSLSFYLHALKYGKLATVSAVVLSGPVFSSTLECWLQKKAPSKHLLFAFFFLLCGMGLVLYAQG